MTSSLIEITATLAFQVASTIGTISFTISGFLIGVRKHLDILGVFIVAALTAIGGGVVRDMLLARVPAILTNSVPLFMIIAVIAAAFCLKLHRKDDFDRKFLFVMSDSIGLVAFSITGALLGIDASLNIFGVMMLAFATAVGGGIIRDTLVNDVPFLLKSEVYGTVALLVGFLLYFLGQIGCINILTIALVAALGLSLRLLAYLKDWHLPKL